MHDAPATKRWERAANEVEGYLFSKFPIRPLNEAELDKYKQRGIKRGWQLAAEFGQQVIQLNILLPSDFPWYPARIAMANLECTTVWPHVEEDGVLCLYPPMETFSVASPVGLLEHTLSEAVTLIENCIAATNQDDFRDEFQAYWNRRTNNSTPVYSLLSTDAITRAIVAWHGTDKIFVADTEKAIKDWLQNRQGKDPCRNFGSGLEMVLPEVLLPAKYPANPLELMNLAQLAGANQALASTIEANPDSIVVLLRMQTTNGVALGPLVLNRQKAQRMAGKIINADPLHKGFRPGHLPPALLVRRYLSGGELTRHKIQRVDSSWVHSRDSDPQHAELRTKRVAIVGCGSLGSSIGALLAASGVGEILFVDGESLAWENIGRHHLGAGDMGKNKAHAMAEKIRKDYPHVSKVDVWVYDWETIPEDDPLIQSCDLVISAVGDWKTEGAMNERHIQNGRRQPIVYAWMEPHALASHALAILATGGCFACHLTPHGTPTFAVTNWATSQFRQEPACGAHFQPYGPMGLADAAGLASKLALDVLLKRVQVSTAHTWIGRTQTLQEMKGYISQHWQTTVEARPGGEFVHAWRYEAREGCPWCSSV